MFKAAFKLFFLWRRNDAASIVFKMLFFGLIVWLVASIFADARNAGIAAAAAALVALIKYSLQARRENARLLEMVGGDKQKLRALKQKFAKDPAAGGMMMEMLRAEMEEGEDDYEDEPELTDEQREENRVASKVNLDALLAAADEHGMEISDREARVNELSEMCADGDYVVSAREMVGTLLDERCLSFMFEDFCNDDDHADLVEQVASCTLGVWQPTEVTSSFDEETDRWVVTFQDDGKPVTWRFSQNGDHLSENFVSQLFKHAQTRSGHELVELDTEDYFEAVLVPQAFAVSIRQAIS